MLGAEGLEALSHVSDPVLVLSPGALAFGRLADFLAVSSLVPPRVNVCLNLVRSAGA